MAVKGENGILYIQVFDIPPFKPVACLTSNSLKTTLSIIESKTKCFPGTIKKSPGMIDNSIDCEGEYIDTTSVGGDTAKKSHDALFLLQQSKTYITWKIDTDILNVNSAKYYGNGFISDLSAAFGSGDDLTTFSATIAVNGNISLTDPNA